MRNRPVAGRKYINSATNGDSVRPVKRPGRCGLKRGGQTFASPPQPFEKGFGGETKFVFSEVESRKVDRSGTARSVRLRRSMEYFVKNTRPNRLPNGKLILLRCAMVSVQERTLGLVRTGGSID